MKSSSKEVSLSIKQSDIGTLYIVQHELLKEITNATESAIKSVDELKKLFKSKIKVD